MCFSLVIVKRHPLKSQRISLQKQIYLIINIGTYSYFYSGYLIFFSKKLFNWNVLMCLCINPLSPYGEVEKAYLFSRYHQLITSGFRTGKEGFWR